MTNEEWLESLAHNDIPALRAWFKAEHPESPESGALVQCAQSDVEQAERGAESDTEPENADSREQLEAEIESYSAFSMMDTITLDMVIGWLDRQAAITEEQTRCKWVTASAEEIAAWRSKAEKLKEQVYELTAERDTLQGALDIAVQNESKLEAERDNLADDLLIANKQREYYRDLFGKCLDYADAIHALMDDEGLA